MTNRDVASLVLFGALLIAVIVVAVRKEDLRSALRGLVRAFLNPKVLLILGWYFGCLTAALLVASRLGIWQWGLWKPTILWLALIGFALLFRYNEVFEQRWFAWRVSIRTIALVEIASFVGDLASFPLWVEIPAQAFAFICCFVAAWGSDKPEHAAAVRLANRYLGIFGVAALLAGIRRTVIDWEDIDHGLLVREFLLPLWLTPVALVCVYAFAMYCVYEVAFKQMTLAGNSSLFAQRVAVVLRTAGRVERLRNLRRAGGWRYAHTSGFRDAWNEVGRVLGKTD